MAPVISLRDANLFLHNLIFHSNVITNLVWLMAAAVFEQHHVHLQSDELFSE